MDHNSKEKLRIGLLLNSEMVPAWFHSMIGKINSSDYAEIVLAIENESSGVPKKSFFRTLRQAFPSLIYFLYRKIENKLLKPQPFAFKRKNIRELIPGTTVLKIKSIKKKYTETLEHNDIEKIRRYNLDVLIQNGCGILKGDILTAAKNGIWSYHHGDNRIMRGGPAGVWESMEGWRDIGCILQILSENLDAGKVIYRSWSQRKLILINDGINAAYWKAVSFIPRKLKDLYESGPDAFHKKIAEENRQISFYSNRLYKTPTNSQFARNILSKLFRKIQLKIWFMFNFEQWILLYAFNKSEQPSTEIFRYKRITPPKDRFWADPFVVCKNDRYYIFLEELIYKQNDGKGHISMIEIDEKGNYTEPKAILKKPYHLSYPFIFEYKGELYMIPETMENSTIELYKCTSFPGNWEFIMNLFENTKAVDTTILEKDGKFWMFTNIKENEGGSSFDELFLFYADDLLTSQWTAHPKNPIVSDVKSARPAGPLFYHNSILYRPSQDCSYRYGYATVINEITELSTIDYKEQPVDNILPNWSKDVVGTHALAHQKKLTVIDALIKRRK